MVSIAAPQARRETRAQGQAPPPVLATASRTNVSRAEESWHHRSARLRPPPRRLKTCPRSSWSPFYRSSTFRRCSTSASPLDFSRGSPALVRFFFLVFSGMCSSHVAIVRELRLCTTWELLQVFFVKGGALLWTFTVLAASERRVADALWWPVWCRAFGGPLRLPAPVFVSAATPTDAVPGGSSGNGSATGVGAGGGGDDDPPMREPTDVARANSLRRGASAGDRGGLVCQCVAAGVAGLCLHHVCQ